MIGYLKNIGDLRGSNLNERTQGPLIPHTLNTAYQDKKCQKWELLLGQFRNASYHENHYINEDGALKVLADRPRGSHGPRVVRDEVNTGQSVILDQPCCSFQQVNKQSTPNRMSKIVDLSTIRASGMILQAYMLLQEHSSSCIARMNQ